MVSTQLFRRRIRSIKNTSQITKAMEMVAATKMRRAQHQALSSRPYSLALEEMLTFFKSEKSDLEHKLLGDNSSSKTGVLVLTTDKSLCGSLNTNLFRLLTSYDFGKEVVFYTIGKKGARFVVKIEKVLEADFENKEIVDYSVVNGLRKYFTNLFIKEQLGRLYVLYPDFVSTLKQEPKLVQLLPIKLEKEGEAASEVKDTREFVIEPETNDLIDYLVNHHLEIQIYQAMLETKASEHSSRMMAMKNAPDSARELIDELSLVYNQVRQDNVTKELLEISTASLALE